MWNIGPTGISYIWFYLRLCRPPLSSFFQPTAFLILFFFQVVLGLPLFLYPDSFSSLRGMLLRSVVYALYDQSEAICFPLFVVPIVVCSFLCQNSCKFFSCHLTLKIRFMRRFTNTWSELLITLVICHVSHSYDSNNLTFALNNRILFPTKIFSFLQTGYSYMKILFALLIWLWTSSEVTSALVLLISAREFREEYKTRDMVG